MALLVLLVVALVVAGCGGDDEGTPIPSDTATALNAELDRVQARIDQGSAGACRDILEGSPAKGPSLERVRELIDAMPDKVDPDVRSALEQSFDRLWELVQDDCDQKAAQEEQAQPEPDTDTNTNTDPEQTTPTEPEPPPTDTGETSPETPTSPDEVPLPPEGDGDNGGAIPGAGNGGGAGPGASKGKKEKPA
jgi:hypothetical protein